MLLKNVVEIWELKNPNNSFFDSVQITAPIDRETLWDYLIIQYGGMDTVEGNSEYFRFMVENFFKTHDWNISKLWESTQFKYEPLDNYRYREETENNEVIDNDKEWNVHNRAFSQTVGRVMGFNTPEPDSVLWKDSAGEPVYISVGNEAERNMFSSDGDEFGTQDIDQTTDFNETVNKTGHSPEHTFQELIEEERTQAEFNIYKWIGRHFSRELLIGIW